MDSPNTNKPNDHIISSLQPNDDLAADYNYPYLISFQQPNQIPADLEDQVNSMGDRSSSKGKSSINYPVGCSTRKKTGGSRGKPAGIMIGGPSGDAGEELEKKMVHREIERQRRQEMAKLYASLRDLLPLQFIKGTRSISDHMQQAVHYITQMEENVKALTMKRDQLLNMSNNENSANNNTVSVSLCNEGVEIIMNSCLIEDGFMLSRVLNALIEEGHNIISCGSTKANDRLLHSIQTEVCDPTVLIDVSVLQQRLVLVSNATDQPNFNF